MSVAVVDGVCVEIRRHSSKRVAEDGSAAEAGVFVAWGHRVERKVTITEEGLEAYFNNLAHVSIPQGLEAKAPFEESCVRFPLTSSLQELLPLSMDPCVDRPSADKLLEGGFCRKAIVESVWAAKKRLDDLWTVPPPPLARSVMTRVARAQLFPCSGEGGKDHENRAGDKLAELVDAARLLDGVPEGSGFLDLCGGPGAWSQYLLCCSSLKLRGFGFTLRPEAGDQGDWQAEAKDHWYPDLFKHPKWRALWGADGSGDLLKAGNLQHCARRLKKESVFLCVADGGFSDKAIPPNHLELYFYRLFLAEVYMALSCLQPGGRFVCKLYSTLSVATSAVLYLVVRAFQRVEVIKPASSRVTGPERYLVAWNFKGQCKEVHEIRGALERAHERCAGESILASPLLEPVVSAADLARDEGFATSALEMTEQLADRQARALNAVVDRAQFLEEVALAVVHESSSGADPITAVRAAEEDSTESLKSDHQMIIDRDEAPVVGHHPKVLSGGRPKWDAQKKMMRGGGDQAVNNDGRSRWAYQAA